MVFKKELLSIKSSTCHNIYLGQSTATLFGWTEKISGDDFNVNSTFYCYTDAVKTISFMDNPKTLHFRSSKTLLPKKDKFKQSQAFNNFNYGQNLAQTTK